MFKALILIASVGLLALAHAQPHHTGIPPVNQSNVTGGSKSALKNRISDIVDDMNAEILKCSKGESKEQKDFLAIYNLISLRVNGLSKQAICENDFVKCIMNDNVSKSLSEVVENKGFVQVLAEEKDLSKKQARDIRKFYRKLLLDLKEK